MNENLFSYIHNIQKVNILQTTFYEYVNRIFPTAGSLYIWRQHSIILVLIQMALTITKDRNIERMVQIIPFLIHSLTYRLPPHRVPIAVDGICPPARTKWRGQRYDTLYTKATKTAFFCYDLVVVIASGRIVFVITATIFSLNLNSPPVCFARVINSD